MLPHERSLVEKMKGRPFTMLGVNTDKQSEALPGGLKDIPWRNFTDGGREGPISSEWGISAWPSVFVLDEKGVIRLGPSAAFERVEEMALKLTSELEASQAAK